MPVGARRHRGPGHRAAAAGRRAPQLRTIQHQSFDDYSAIADAFAGVDACLYCLGKSSTQVSGEAEYRRLTYDYALAAARAVWRGSPDAVFQFISGASTRIDSRYMWARVKAETERDLLADGHPANCWRPASIDGVPSASEPLLFRLARPVMRLLKPFRSLYVRAEDIGLAMLAATGQGIRGRIFENAEIRDLADRARPIRSRKPGTRRKESVQGSRLFGLRGQPRPG